MKFKFTENVLCVRFDDKLSAKTLEEALEETQKIEQEKDFVFNKFVDLTKIDSVNISSNEVSMIAYDRKIFVETLTGKFKTAILVNSPLTYGIVRMFQTLIESEKITAKEFYNLQEAADWLGVDVAILKPDSE